MSIRTKSIHYSRRARRSTPSFSRAAENQREKDNGYTIFLHQVLGCTSSCATAHNTDL